MDRPHKRSRAQQAAAHSLHKNHVFHDLQEEILVEILAHVLSPFTLCHTVSRSNRRFSSLFKANRVWRGVCELRWKGRPQSLSWCAHATAEAIRGVQDAWWAGYQMAEEQLVPTYPVFYMSGELRLGSVIGMHFFEPRYRQLIRKITVQCEDARFACKFAFFSRCPVGPEKLDGWVCEAQDIHVHADGRADLDLVPVARISRRSAWADSTGLRPNDPPLFYVKGEIQVPSEEELDHEGSEGSSVETDNDNQLLSDEDFGILVAQPEDSASMSDSEDDEEDFGILVAQPEDSASMSDSEDEDEAQNHQ